MEPIEQNLFEPKTYATAYAIIHDRLSSIREEFHRNGRMDDSNAKLDEVIKLFAAYLAYRLGEIGHFPAEDSDDGGFVAALQKAFQEAAAAPCFMRNDGISVFGPKPSLVFSNEEVALAKRLTGLVTDAVSEAFEQHAAGNPYDILNEAFGHFVRDNFRGNIEDAQYLTPAEVVDFMVNVALKDLQRDGRLASKESLVVADPCCGVGSFLTAFAAKYRDAAAENPPLVICGQDKVERMVRIATVNLALFRLFDHTITIGNSLFEHSPLDALNGTVDVILTNPPFGARFTSADVFTHCAANTPFFSKLRKLRGPFDSELLFIDRNLALLKEGGLLMIVIPDGIVSASGLAAILRLHLRENVEVRSVVDLPSVTFAQAGTRTRTSILYLRKCHPASRLSDGTFLATVDDLGFQVSSRKGVQVKIAKGLNELPAVLGAYENRFPSLDQKAVRVSQDLLGDAWTPKHYISKAEHAVQSSSDEVQPTDLAEIVEFCSDGRRMQKHQDGHAYISVLHVLGEGLMDVAAAQVYAPKTPGVPINPGEVLLSRINPRIPRVIVAPDLGKPLLCSSEFEVMRPKGDWDSFSIAYLLLSPAVQKQIQSLTSGTSASHNRVKTRELASIRIPVPRKGTKLAKLLKRRVFEYSSALESITNANLKIASLRAEDTEFI